MQVLRDASAVQVTSEENGVQRQVAVRYGMVIDLKRCIGCYGCQMSCKAEHATPSGVLFARVVRQEEGTFPAVRRTPLPLLCFHCEEPPCERVCPTGATAKRDDGIVKIDQELCIGCRYCMQACPYEARSFLEEIATYFPGHLTPYEEIGLARYDAGTVQKCDFCSERVAQGIDPACVVNCMAKARTFGNLNDPDSEVSRLIRKRNGLQLRPEMGTNPSVFYLAP